MHINPTAHAAVLDTQAGAQSKNRAVEDAFANILAAQNENASAAKTAAAPQTSPQQNYLLALQETDAAQPDTDKYDFTNMTRQEIENTGKALFKDAKISIDELFRFQHPDGKLRIDLNGNYTALNPNDRINFTAETRKAIANIEARHENTPSNNFYHMMRGLMEKLQAWQA